MTVTETLKNAVGLGGEPQSQSAAQFLPKFPPPRHHRNRNTHNHKPTY